MVRGQLPLIKERKNKANLQFHFMPILLAKLKHIRTDTHTFWQGCRESGTLLYSC